jgi:asparagine synthase (glutamine-hydrolysing)
MNGTIFLISFEVVYSMCGIAGFIDKGIVNYIPNKILFKMGNVVLHRGPNDNGEWFDSKFQIGFAHRRLSIQDTSVAGHQPMFSKSGRFVIIFNGEIYNHLSLRKLLEKSLSDISFRGNSDTETILACLDEWGLKETIKRLRGMFAIAIWDNLKKSLFLIRDRVGEKPLYYGWANNVFLFGSELKSFKQHPKFKPEVNRGSISLLLRLNCIPAPYSIYKEVFKLKPGHILELCYGERMPKIWNYWSVSELVNNAKQNRFLGTPSDAVKSLENLALDAVKSQMIGDVPVGAFLSGGIDSSTIVSLMQANSINPVKTFSIGFEDQQYNEAEYAKKIAKHLGTDHSELYVTSKQALNAIPKLTALNSEPFADSSQIPTYLVSELAKKEVTVSLSGDAGDELFCGYNRYIITNRLWEKLSMFPVPIRKIIANLILSISPNKWDALSIFIPGSKKLHNFGDKVHKSANVLPSASLDELYLSLISHFRLPENIVINGTEPTITLTDQRNKLSINQLDNVERMMALDLLTYLPDDILTKVDRASMAVSLETRVPFLDHRIIEFAWSLPLSCKIRNGKSKWPLRQLLNNYVPKELFERPKMGFSIPVDLWLRGSLRDWAEELLSEERLMSEGYLQKDVVRRIWNEHISGKKNWQHHLWNILMFQAWLENEKSP